MRASLIEPASRLTHERVAMPSPVPGFRRIYVAPRDELFGSLHMYAIPHDDPRVQVVRSLGIAFAELGVAPGEFEPLGASGMADERFYGRT